MNKIINDKGNIMNKKNEQNELKNPQLKAILNKLGKNPIAEKDIYEIMTSDSVSKMSDVVKLLMDKHDKDISKFKNKDLALFFHDIRNRIMSFKYDTGNFKSTDATKELDVLSFEEEDILSSLVIKIHDIDIDDEDAIKKYNDEVEDYIWGVCSLNKDDLTEWERGLVIAQLTESANNIKATALGVSLGN